MTKPGTARIYRGTPHNLALLARRLHEGDVVAVPTETVYGLAANALNAAACRKIFAAKGRPPSDPLIVHLHSVAQLDAVCEPNSAAEVLALKFWPGPLTMVLPKKPAVPALVTSGHPSVAVRVPAHPLFRRLLKLTGLPLAAPSANPFGYVSPTTAAHVRDGLGRKISHILDGGPARIGVESTIVDLRDPGRPRLLRPGAVTLEQLETALGRPVLPAARSAKLTAGKGQVAPGLLARHYSPRTPVELHETLPPPSNQADAYVFLRQPAGPWRKNIFWLDARGDLRGAARALFATLRRLDALHFRCIHVELAPGGGLADAINDRLRRASAR